MKPFPSTFTSSWQVSRSLAALASWSGGRTATVWIPQFASLRNHVREISRTPARTRVAKLSRVLSVEPDMAEISASLQHDRAAELLAACLEEAPALLELGYPAGEGLDFVTRMPSPAGNTRRTSAQMRAAVHHLGGDFGLLLDLLKVDDQFAPCLRTVFSVWPRFTPPGESEALQLVWSGSRMPTAVSFRTDLRGYALLCMYDLSQRLRASEGIQPSAAGFEAFASDPG